MDGAQSRDGGDAASQAAAEQSHWEVTESDFSRGRRLKSLLKLLLGKKATSALFKLRLHMW